MEKISVSNIVEFRRKTPDAQITFVNNWNKPKKKNKPENGGDYWVHSLSVIGKTFVSEEIELLGDKINILTEKYNTSTVSISKEMFQRNITILKNFEKFKFSKIKPNSRLKYLSKPKDKSIIMIKDLPVQVLPQHVFTFNENKTEKIAAVWFVAKIEGYKIEELAIFVDALCRYLKWNYSKEYEISNEFCIAVDAINLNYLSYNQMLNKHMPLHLNSTLESIKRILK